MRLAILWSIGAAVAGGLTPAIGVVVDEPRATAHAYAMHDWVSQTDDGSGLSSALAEAHAGDEWTPLGSGKWDSMSKAKVGDGKVKAYALRQTAQVAPGEAQAEAIWLSKWRVLADGFAPGVQVAFAFDLSFQGTLQLTGERAWELVGDDFSASAEGIADLYGAGSGYSKGTARLYNPGTGTEGPDPDFTLETTGAWIGKTSGDPKDGLVTLNYAETMQIIATMGEDLWISMELRTFAKNPGGERMSLADFYNSGEFTFPTTGTIYQPDDPSHGTTVALNFQFIPEPTQTTGLIAFGLVGWVALRRSRRSET